MEHHNLDPLNEHHLWDLHYTRSLQEFVHSWNNHPLRTAGHKSLQQLFTAGALLLQNSQIAALDFFNSVDESYVIDPDGSIPGSKEGIIIPQNTLRFSEDDLQVLRQHVDPFGASDNYGIDLYEPFILFPALFLFKM